MASPTTSLVWADGQVTEVTEVSAQLEFELGRLLGMSPAVYLNGREHLSDQVDMLGDGAAKLGYEQFDAASVSDELAAQLEASGVDHLVASLVPGTSSHKAAPPGSSWFLHVERFDVEADPDGLYLGVSPTVRNHLGVSANLLLLDDLEMDLAGGDGFDAVLWLNSQGNVACADQSAVVIREGTVHFTPPLADGAIESGWRGRAVVAGDLVESSISFDRLLGADEIFCLTPWGQRIRVASVDSGNLLRGPQGSDGPEVAR